MNVRQLDVLLQRNGFMNAQLKSILVAGALVTAASYSAAHADNGRSARDQQINDAVVAKIASDSRLRPDGAIQVDTRDGNVTLTGFVDLPDQADKIGIDAESVEGVKDVDNEVRPRVGTAF
jgi:osmotically-inducible protein OsmY